MAAAKQYYHDNLQDTYLTTRIGRLGAQDIHFTGNGWHKLSHELDKNPLKAALIEDIPNIVDIKNYLPGSNASKVRTDYDKFHYFRAKINKTVNGKPKHVTVQVDVGEKLNSKGVYEVYHLSHDKKKEAEPTVAGRQLSSASTASPDPDNSKAKRFEFVNMEIIGVSEIPHETS